MVKEGLTQNGGFLRKIAARSQEQTGPFTPEM
jgi:hypothetical protein